MSEHKYVRMGKTVHLSVGQVEVEVQADFVVWDLARRGRATGGEGDGDEVSTYGTGRILRKAVHSQTKDDGRRVVDKLFARPALDGRSQTRESSFVCRGQQKWVG